MSFGSDLTEEQLNILRQRYTLVEKHTKVSNCLHKSCSECNGTGIRKDGRGMCIHGIACPCPDCSFTC